MAEIDNITDSVTKAERRLAGMCIECGVNPHSPSNPPSAMNPASATSNMCWDCWYSQWKLNRTADNDKQDG